MYAPIRERRLHLPPTAFSCAERKKRRANGGGSVAKCEGERKQKREEIWNKRDFVVSQDAREGNNWRTFFKSQSFSRLNTEGGIHLHLFFHPSVYRSTSVWFRRRRVINLRRETNQSAGPPAVLWHTPTLLSGPKRRGEEEEVREGNGGGSCCSAVTHSCPQDSLDL